MKDMGYEFPLIPIPEGESTDRFLRTHLEPVWPGAMAVRRAPSCEAGRKQVEKELALIAKLGLAGYFLIVWDIVEFCRKHGILVQGRGSAANSAVCYSLGITAVDPVGMELLFERFLSEVRGEWPDIDLDLPSGDDRERASNTYTSVTDSWARRCARTLSPIAAFPPPAASRQVAGLRRRDARPGSPGWSALGVEGSDRHHGGPVPARLASISLIPASPNISNSRSGCSTYPPPRPALRA